MTQQRMPQMYAFPKANHGDLDELMAPSMHIPPATIYVSGSQTLTSKVQRVDSPVSISLVARKRKENHLLLFEPEVDLIYRPDQQHLFTVDPWFYSEVMAQNLDPCNRHLSLILSTPMTKERAYVKLSRLHLKDLVELY